jgi:hypothetical protein
MFQMSTEVRVITTIGQLDLQETTNINTSNLKRGEIVRLKVAKPEDARPYGYAEVLVVADSTAKIRRFS